MLTCSTFQLVIGSECVKLLTFFLIVMVAASASCASWPMDLTPWLFGAAIMPLLIDVFFLIVACYFAISSRHLESFGERRLVWAILSWDVASAVWLGMGIVVVAHLHDCDDAAAIAIGIVYLTLLIVRSTVLGVVYYQRSQ